MRCFSCLSALLRIVVLSMGLPLAGLADDMATTATNSPSAVAPSTNAPPSTATTPAVPSGLYTLKVNSLAGAPVDLGQYAGHVTLVVNSASKSIYGSQQMLGLEKLYEDNKDQGFVVLVFPSNDFGRMEPGTPEETTAAYAAYKVTFPIFEKVSIHGTRQSPVYQFLTAGREMPTWNFHKYLIDKTGKVIGEFSSQTMPDNKDLLAAIDAALK